MSLSSLIYLDHASTSFPKPEVIARGMEEMLCTIKGFNPFRNGAQFYNDNNIWIEKTRGQLARFLGIRSHQNIAFTYNATHAINIVLKGFLRPFDHVILTNFEHNAVWRPLSKLVKEKNISFTIFSSDQNGCFDLHTLPSLFKENTRLLIANHASNVIGVKSPIELMGQIAKENKVSFLVDCTQTAGHTDIHVDRASIDFLAGTAHKGLLGPPGVGFLYVRHAKQLEPLYEGGSGYHSLSEKHPTEMPLKFEAGTLNYLGIACFQHCLAFVQENRESLISHQQQLLSHLLQGLQTLDDIIIYGVQDIDNKVPIVSMNIPHATPQSIAHFLRRKNIMTRPGIQCAPLIHDTLQTIPTGTLRISPGFKNTLSDIDQLMEGLKQFQRQEVYA